MYQLRGRTVMAVAAAAVAAASLSACSHPAGVTGETAPARMQKIGGALSVVLTPLGRARIGIRTATAEETSQQVVIPFDALLYEPDGQAAVYTETNPLTFTRAFIKVASINGNDVTVSSGLSAGTKVVVQGAEELLGVQNGVGVET